MTLYIVIATVLLSLLALSKREISNNLIFNPYMVSRHKQWYRLLTAGFIHADFIHLFVNMFVLYSFGPVVERQFTMILGDTGFVIFLVYYLIGLVVSILPTYFKQKENYLYNGLGASGSVSAVLFTFILFFPWQKIYLYGLIGIRECWQELAICGFLVIWIKKVETTSIIMRISGEQFTELFSR